MINQYWESIGGKPSVLTPVKGPGRKRNLSTPASDDGTTTKKRRESSLDEKASVQSKVTEISNWKPPADLENWDDKVAHIETVEKTDSGLILVYLQWYIHV